MPPPPEAKVQAPESAPEGQAAPADPQALAKKKRMVLIGVGAAAVIVLGAAGFFAYQSFFASKPPPPPPPKAKAPAAKAPPAKSAPAPTASKAGTPAPAAPATPSTTANAIAQVPGQAVTKAKDAVEARKTSGQADVEPAIGTPDLANKPAAGAPTAVPATKSATALTSVGKGVSATTTLEAGTEASAEFRSFVANAKVSGVFQGNPARAMINGRLVRSGEMVEANLGIRFEGVDTEKRHLIFKDKSGALVARKY